MFSKACEYGIRAMILTAWRSREGGRINIGEISEQIGSPSAFTAKVMQQLVRDGLVSSLKGPTGGFYLSPQQMAEVRLSQVVAAIDGDSIYRGCGLGLSECSDEMPCPVHDRFVAVREELRQMLETTRIKDLCEGLDTGTTFLNRIALNTEP